MKKENRDEAVAWLVVRIGLLVISFFFLAYIFIWKQPCDSDAVFLSCRVTGTVGDWIGILLFVAGMVWMSGLVKGISNLSNPPGSSKYNYLLFAMMVLGVILFWNL